MADLRRLSHWDYRFLDMARYVSGWSKDPSTKVGAVIASPHRRVIATGFNGLPSGVEDTLERLHDRDLKYQMIVHAERNAILDARQSLRGFSLYVWPMMPCAVCATMIIQTGLAEVVAPHSDNPRWVDSFRLTEEMFREAGVTLLIAHDLPNPLNMKTEG
ncbi:MAG: deaminase [Magnetospirillum sp. WYHS-4]